jgi:trigger factor
MQTVVETLNSFTRKLKLEISREDLLPLQDKLFKNYQRQTTIPGFRPGKAPLNILRQRYKDKLKQELIEEALRQFYGKALDEAKINPVSEGRITSFKFDDIDSGMQFEFELEVEPEIEIRKYKGLKVEKDLIEVTDHMVNDALERLREQYATVKEVGEAKTGHYLHFDAQELDKGDFPIIGHKYENLQVKLGSGKFDTEIEKQLEGIKTGDKRIVRKEMPPVNPKDKEPQLSSMEILVKKIEEKDFPELNDDFVKNLNDESLETLPQLRTRIQENIQLDFQYRSENSLQSRLIDELLKENPFEVPPGMVENYLNRMIQNIGEQSKDKVIDEEAIRKEYRASAIHNLRWYFLKKKLIEIENIFVPDAELRQLIDQSDLEEKEKKRIRNDQHYLDHLREDLLEKRVLNLLRQYAEVTEIYPIQKKVKEQKQEQQ